MKTLGILFIATISLVLFSCENIEPINLQNTDDAVLKSAEVAVSDIQLESVAEEIGHEAEMFAEYEHILRRLSKIKGHNVLHKNWGKRYMAEEALEVTVDTSETGYPVTITLDYGEGAELKNGKVISGVMVVEISAPKGTDGSTRTFTYTDMMLDSIGVDGVCIQTFNGDNESTRTTTHTCEVTFTLPDGTTVIRSGERLRNWLTGLDTPQEREDDQMEITGTITLESSTGDVWTKEIIEPLLKTGDCRHPVSGIVQITYNGTVSSLLDFGDGTCDELAILTVNGEEIEIELKGEKPEANRTEKGEKGDKGPKNGGQGNQDGQGGQGKNGNRGN